MALPIGFTTIIVTVNRHLRTTAALRVDAHFRENYTQKKPFAAAVPTIFKPRSSVYNALSNLFKDLFTC